MPNTTLAPNAPAADAAVMELQAILVKYDFMTEDQAKTGPGILGPKTKAAVERILENKGPAPVPTAPVAPKKPSTPAQAGPVGTHFYIVQAGESPEEIARELGVSVAQLVNHPENAFMKERQSHGHYPLQPGDRIAVPDKARPMKKQAQPAQHDPSMLEAFLHYIQELVEDHPASQAHPAKKTPAAKKKPSQTAAQKPAVKVLPLQGYTKKHPRLQSRVVLTHPIESAFLVLVDYLPKSVVMTSGYRSDADQARVINDYYAKNKGNPLVTDVEKRRLWLKDQGLTIAKVGRSPHRTGLAFDLSGADVDTINAAVHKCAKEQGARFPLLNTIPERSKKQNCLHVNLKPTAASA